MIEKPDFDALAKAMEASAKHERVVIQILTLAVEYEDKQITAERFAERILETMRRNYSEYVKSEPQGERK